MEDALVQVGEKIESKAIARLNPCFNGRCTRTEEISAVDKAEVVVLILVLMEDALVLSAKVE